MAFNLNAMLAAIKLFQTYAPIALTTIQEVEANVGAGNGQMKKALTMSTIMSIAHAGETVPVQQVQIISGVVDLIVNTLNGMGELGKPPVPVIVPVTLPVTLPVTVAVVSTPTPTPTPTPNPNGV